MAQQLINVGAVGGDRTGDLWRDAMIKVNANETELFASVGADNAEYISKESDFPTQDGSTITLAVDTPHIITKDFSTAKNIICLDGSSWTSRNVDGPKCTFTGSGTMFSGTDVNFIIHDTNIDPGIGNQAFSFTDTIGGIKKFFQFLIQIDNCLRWGTFTDMFVVQLGSCRGVNVENGFRFLGTSGTVFTLSEWGVNSTNAGFKGIDLGTATAVVIEFTNMFMTAPAGAFGISGLASNGNVPTGRLAMVQNCEFLGGMTDLENITIDDIRWLFQNNNPTPDTFPEALLSLTSNATATVIAAANTPVLVAGTWVVENVSHFSGTTAGRSTYNGERDIAAPITVSLDLEPSSGTNKDLKAYIALNGTVISPTGRLARVDSGNPQSMTTIWQLTLTTTDFIEVFVENTTDTVNILVSGSVERVR